MKKWYNENKPSTPHDYTWFFTDYLITEGPYKTKPSHLKSNPRSSKIYNWPNNLQGILTDEENNKYVNIFKNFPIRDNFTINKPFSSYIKEYAPKLIN